MPIIPVTQKAEVGRAQSDAGPGKSMRPYLKHKNQKTWSVNQVVEHLPSKHEALNSIPSSTHTHTKSVVDNREFSHWTMKSPSAQIHDAREYVTTIVPNMVDSFGPFCPLNGTD
jgi:hypothetical protein